MKKSQTLSEDSFINKLKKENFIYKSISSEFSMKDEFPEKNQNKKQFVKIDSSYKLLNQNKFQNYEFKNEIFIQKKQDLQIVKNQVQQSQDDFFMQITNQKNIIAQNDQESQFELQNIQFPLESFPKKMNSLNFFEASSLKSLNLNVRENKSQEQIIYTDILSKEVQSQGQILEDPLTQFVRLQEKVENLFLKKFQPSQSSDDYSQIQQNKILKTNKKKIQKFDDYKHVSARKIEIWKQQIVEMNQIQKEVRNFRNQNKNNIEINLKEMVDQLIKNIVLHLRKLRNLITARQSRLKEKEAPQKMMTSIDKYKDFIQEIYKIHQDVLQDKPELFQNLQEKIKIKENQIFNHEIPFSKQE